MTYFFNSVTSECATYRASYNQGIMPEETLSCKITNNGSAEDRVFGFSTRALHTEQRPDSETRSRALPIYHTT